jgi:hypothetical protein
MDCFGAVQDALGLCIERRVDLGNAILAFLGVLGLVSLYLGYRQLKLSREAQSLEARATRARFVLDLNQEFFAADADRKFFYQLDYLDFRFDPDRFAQSDEERQLDRLLYKLSYVGKLLREGHTAADRRPSGA